jgi:raffinose/stachyose/melibiose transport system permease protein
MSYKRTGIGWIRQPALIVVALIFALPLYVVIVTAFKSPSATATSPLSIPSNLYFDNFSTAWTEGGVGKAMLSSTVITVGSVLALICLGVLASYPLARRQQRMGDRLYMLFLLGIILPFQLGMIPLYTLMRDLGLLGTYWSLIIFYAGAQLPFTIFLYTGFLRQLPADYEEAAWLDGASQLQTFRLVVFPLLRPVTGVVIILNAVFVWNDLLTPLLYLSGSGHETLPVAIYAFVGQYFSQWNLIFAGVVLASLPMLALFFLLQKSFIASFGSAIKG